MGEIQEIDKELERLWIRYDMTREKLEDIYNRIEKARAKKEQALALQTDRELANAGVTWCND